MKKILSIAVPAYNSEKFLDICLTSLIDDSILDDLEVIVVNDGSKDNTKQIAERYVKKYPDTFILINQNNGGHGAAVNTGMKSASANYFVVLDSDDWFDTKALVAAVNTLKNIDSDVLILNYHEADEVSKIKKPQKLQGYESGKEYDIRHVIDKNSILFMTNIIYKNSVLKAVNFRMQERTYYVDEEYCTIPFAQVKSVYYLDEYLYNYLVGQQQQSTATVMLVKNFDHKVRVMKKLIAFYEDNKDKMAEVNREYCFKKVCKSVLYSLPISALYFENRKEGKSKFDEFRKYLKENCKDVYSAMRMQYLFFSVLYVLRIKEKGYKMILKVKEKF